MRTRERPSMTTIVLVLIVAVCFLYLLAAVLRPERF
jgi:K+-transporting ATPase KdpF subunit